jgi:PKD repeat protein
MKQLLLLITTILFSVIAYSQNQILPFTNGDNTSNSTLPVRTVFDEGPNGLYVKYDFSGAVLKQIVEDGDFYHLLNIENFSHLQNIGKPAIPATNDIIIIPEGASIDIQITEQVSKIYNNFMLYPALEPATDTYGDDEPEFYIDADFYNQNVQYPSNIVNVNEIIEIKGIKFAIVQIAPIQYNPSTKQLKVYSKIEYTINFTGNPSSFILSENKYSNNFLKNLINIPLNNSALNTEINSLISNNNIANADPNYLIITHQDYIDAADSLALWKSQMGYKVEIISNSTWTSTDVKNQIQSRYSNYSPKPDYFVIIGDHDKVPGEVVVSQASSNDDFATDLYYACMDGTNDFVPDMAYGRISVANQSQSLSVIQKIINYERNPNSDPNYYQTGINAAYFQHAGNGYAERRFAQTSEDVLQHLDTNYNYNVNRVYVTGASVNPLYWNNGYYSNGESLPNYLKKPTFPWTGTASDIQSEINAGRFYVLHRDHGFSGGWGDPYFTSTHVGQLTNSAKPTVVFSVNCLTGKYYDNECFAEKFLRHPNGGAAGIFAHGEISYSGYNDGLTLGMFDAMFSNPGLVPTFTGSGGVTNPNLSPHNDIFKTGDIKNQGLIRMIETWGGNTGSIRYTHEMINYFGDPAMKIWTQFPSPITANHLDTLHCANDSVLNLTNVSIDGLATLTLYGELISSADIVNGSASLNFNELNGDTAILTITNHNSRPYIKYIIIEGGCPRARFDVSATNFCVDDSIFIQDLSSGNIMSYQWNFGANANPQTANTQGPFYIDYSSSGNKLISLTVTDSNNNTSTYAITIDIDQYCNFYVPASGNNTISRCQGRLYDNGGIFNYTNDAQGSFTINAPGASSISLVFNSFNFELNYDFLKIYDGSSTSAPLIGTYTGTVLPGNGMITSTSSSITIEQISDSYLNEDGFMLDWYCNMANSAPSVDFIAQDTVSCTGEISFYDFSLNGPANWHWDFGDGNFSTQQNPTHLYQNNGTYDVKLIVSNNFGTDSIVKNSIVNIQRPLTPNPFNNKRCKSGSIDISVDNTANGTVYWYETETSSNVLDTGDIFSINNLLQTDTFYAEVHQKPAPVFTAKPNNMGGGGYFTANSSHYLVFDCYEAVNLYSVVVYASSAGNRTIMLRNSGGGLIQSKSVYIPQGMQRIILDFDIPIASNLQLSAPAYPDLYRNNDGINYPYDLQGKLSIKHSSASSNPTGYYYFFYDWEIYGDDCVSLRTPVIAEVKDSLQPISGFDYNINDPVVSFSDTSKYADSYYWDFGDGDFSLLPSPTHTFQSDNTFNVSFTAANQCGTDVSSQAINIQASGLEDTNLINSFNLYPNPSSDFVVIEFNANSNLEGELLITDIIGKTLYAKDIDISNGNNTFKIDISNFASGVYNLQIFMNELTVNQQIIKK